jgi:hypothetical protein
MEPSLSHVAGLWGENPSLGLGLTVHGFRSTFLGWAAERTDVPLSGNSVTWSTSWRNTLLGLDPQMTTPHVRAFSD